MTPRRRIGPTVPGLPRPVVVLLLAFAVALMHTGLPAPMAPAAPHHVTTPAVAPPVPGTTHAEPARSGPADGPHATAAPDAICEHSAHLCAGTVVVHAPIAPPGLVAVLPRVDLHASARDLRGGARDRGPPPWTAPDIYALSVLRI